ncbi:peroxiredoxin [Arenibacter sp. GZD96]|uniref:peroxiredoxin n=1 Tax=Aurantibrevibacter litoralis TaxID=3106030 RepID=UPI002AFF82DC|nr:peroxiredoxin [Arenibacter sp. GZD-96]MEA1787527.1 peroxiredoxin [Arenibacter sp. GZD-96]
MGVQIGDKVPEFSLLDQHGQWFSIGSILGKKPFVLFFYPKDNTPGCTKEACDFRDGYDDFKGLGAEVIGISADTHQTHSGFAKKHRLPFLLLSDRQNKVRKLFGVKPSFLGLLPGRETYVVDKAGTIIMIYNSINALQHRNSALHALKAL